jgi:hypothetical protein
MARVDSDRQHLRIIGWQKGAAHMRTALSIGDILWCYSATNGSFNDSMFLPGSFMKGDDSIERSTAASPWAPASGSW